MYRGSQRQGRGHSQTSTGGSSHSEEASEADGIEDRRGYYEKGTNSRVAFRGIFCIFFYFKKPQFKFKFYNFRTFNIARDSLLFSFGDNPN